MNKKVDEEFKHIHDEYLLQCTCTEMKDKINNLQLKIDKAIELLQLLHYKFKDEDSIHNEIEDIQKVLKENK